MKSSCHFFFNHLGLPTPQNSTPLSNSISNLVSWFLTLYSSVLLRTCLHSTMLKSKSNSCYDRLSVGQSALVSSCRLGLKTRYFFHADSSGFVDMGALSDERTCLSFTVYKVLINARNRLSLYRRGADHI
jgi:hypothetical protein